MGPKIRKARFQRGWSQQDLAVKLQLAGFDISRTGVAKIEMQIRGLSDRDLLYFLKVFRIGLEELLSA